MIRPLDDINRTYRGEPEPLRPICASGLALLFLAICSSWAAPVAAELRLLQPPTSTPPHLQQPLEHRFEPTGHPLPEAVFPLQLVFSGEAPEGLTREEIKEAIKGAVRAWNQVPCSRARLKWAGFQDERDELEPGLVPVQFSTGEGDYADLLAWTVLPQPDEAPEGMSVHLNHPRYRWSIRAHPFEDLEQNPRPTLALQSVLTHEFGHLLGLQHSGAHRAATMAPAYLRDGSQAQLSADDKLRLCQLYPQRGSECAGHADCPGSCVEGPWGRVCDIHLGAVGDYCGFELQYCPDYCHLSEPSLGIGYCSTACADDEACPEGFRCERPENFTASVCIFAPPQEPFAATCATSGTSQSPLFWFIAALAALLAQRRRS